MPKMSENELVILLKRDRETSGIPIILATS